MIETIRLPQVRITCDRCRSSGIFDGTSWSSHTVYLAERPTPTGKLQPMVSPNCVKNLCDKCAKEYEEWWLGP